MAIRSVGEKVKQGLSPHSFRRGKLVDLTAAIPTCARRVATIRRRAVNISGRIEYEAALRVHTVSRILKGVERVFGPSSVRSMLQLEYRSHKAGAAGDGCAVEISALVEPQSAARVISLILIEAVQRHVVVAGGCWLKLIDCAVA